MEVIMEVKETNVVNNNIKEQQEFLHQPTPPLMKKTSSSSSIASNGSGPPSPRKKKNMMQSSNVKRTKKEKDWVAQERRLEVIQFLQIHNREKRICKEIDSLVDFKQAETFHHQYTNAMTKKKKLHDEKIILYSHAREFDRSEKERFSQLNIELKQRETYFHDTSYHPSRYSN